MDWEGLENRGRKKKRLIGVCVQVIKSYRNGGKSKMKEGKTDWETKKVKKKKNNKRLEDLKKPMGVYADVIKKKSVIKGRNETEKA